VVLRELQSHSTEMAVVIDEYGAPAGVVTLEDLVEELVGEIEDEYDPALPGEYIEREPGVWAIAATCRPDEIERYTGFTLPDGEYDTVAGLVLDRLEGIGEIGDAVVVDGMRIEVLAVEEFAITEVLLQLDPDAGVEHDDAGDSGDSGDSGDDPGTDVHGSAVVDADPDAASDASADEEGYR